MYSQTEEKLDLHVEGLRLSAASTLWRMTGDSLAAANHVGHAPQVEIKKVVLDPAPHSIPVAPLSINIYQFPVAH